MRLTLKLTLGILLGVGLTLLVNVILRADRESELLENDIKKDHLVLGHALSVDIVEEWRDRGPESALALVKKMNSERAGIDISAARIEALPHSVSLALLSPPHRSQVFEGADAQEHLVTWLPLSVHGSVVAALRLDESLVPARAYVRSSVVRTAISAVVGLLASSLLAFGFGFVLVGQPVRKIVDKARRTGRGDFSGPLAAQRGDELGVLAQEINNMCDKLAQARSELEQATEQRIAAVQQLRHADRMSTVGLLAAGIAHELGTPLNIVAGRGRLIADEPGATEAAERGGRIIEEQALRMTHIVRQLLDFARSHRPKKTTVDLRRVARDTIEMLRAIAQKRDVRLDWDASDTESAEEFQAHVDAGQLQQAITNLVVNAIHASPRGAAVRIAVARSPEGTSSISVEDQGAGMDSDTMKNLFTPFFTTKDVGEGTGLGLAVAWGLVEENGGRISVISKVGRGSNFTIHLPGGGP
jgi:two-component system NtrC family sensor kinase